MSEDLNLPASLERLEINPERVDCCKIDHNRNVLVNLNPEPECALQSLSLKAECPKGNCHCNRKREKEVTVKRLPFKRPIVRRSKLNPLVLRSPVLRLRENSTAVPVPQSARCSSGPPGGTVPQPAITGATVTTPSPVLSQTEDSSTQSLTQPLSRVVEEDRLVGSEALSVADSVPPPLPTPNATSSSSCAVQARSSPDDTTIDELASYFDLFVHIPKKMSFMAEMMYT